MRDAADIGFGAVEISDGTIEVSAFRRRHAIDCALEAGLVAVTEVGKKDPAMQPPIAELARQAQRDLDWGARWVIVEGRESGMGVGVFDARGNVTVDDVETFASILDGQQHRLIWEAPLKHQQAALIARFGLNVGLGNIAPEGVLALEALRLGLRFETLKPIADELRISGRCASDQIEAVLIGEAIDGRASLTRPLHAFATTSPTRTANGMS